MRLTLGILVALLASTSLAQTQHSVDQSSRQLEQWRWVKRSLQRPDPKEEYFRSNVKGTFVLGCGPHGLNAFIGTVLSSKPTDHPGELVLALSDMHTPEVTVRFVDVHGKMTTLNEPVPNGTKVAFEGIGKEFTREPFMLTFDVDPSQPIIFPLLLDPSLHGLRTVADPNPSARCGGFSILDKSRPK